MNKKFMYFSLFFDSLCLIAVVVVLLAGPGTKEELAKGRIEAYTNRYFTSVDTLYVSTFEGDISVFLSYIPEVGSFPVKQEIYEHAANHALQIKMFFPETIRFEYTVLWDDYAKKKAMHLVMNQEAVEQLRETYTGELVNRNGGVDTHFERVFSSIEETEESEQWHDRPDPDA